MATTLLLTFSECKHMQLDNKAIQSCAYDHSANYCNIATGTYIANFTMYRIQNI